jgi:hypothetical protein
MSQRNTSFGHHFHEISKAELEPKIPGNAKDDDLTVEMAAFEKIIHAQHLGGTAKGDFPANMPQFRRVHHNRYKLEGLACAPIVSFAELRKLCEGDERPHVPARSSMRYNVRTLFK